MAQRGIREYHGKKMMAKYWSEYFGNLQKYEGKVALVNPETSMDDLVKQNPWLTKEKLVAKPDQLFGKRGKHNLILLNAPFEEAKKWIKDRMGKTVKIGKATDKLSHFLVEPYVPHNKSKEYYFAITSNREGDAIHFSAHGGVDIEEVWDTVVTIPVPVLTSIENIKVREKLPKAIPVYRRFLAACPLEKASTPSAADVAIAKEIIHPKDASILMAAMNAQVDYLVTLNRKHFLDDPEVARTSGLRIGAPDDFLAWLRKQLER